MFITGHVRLILNLHSIIHKENKYTYNVKTKYIFKGQLSI